METFPAKVYVGCLLASPPTPQQEMTLEAK